MPRSSLTTLRLVIEGESTKQIARAETVAVDTVKSRVSKLLELSGTPNRAALVSWAFRSKIARQDRQHDPLVVTPRRATVLLELRKGSSNEEIAEALGIALATVRTAMGALARQTGARNRQELVALAYRHGVVIE